MCDYYNAEGKSVNEIKEDTNMNMNENNTEKTVEMELNELWRELRGHKGHGCHKGHGPMGHGCHKGHGPMGHGCHKGYGPMGHGVRPEFAGRGFGPDFGRPEFAGRGIRPGFGPMGYGAPCHRGGRKPEGFGSVMRTLYKGGSLSQKALAEKLNVPAVALSAKLYQLQEKGLVTADFADGEIRYAVSEKAAAFIAAKKAEHEARRAERFACLTDDEKAELVRLLRKLSDAKKAKEAERKAAAEANA